MIEVALHGSSFVASRCGYSPDNRWEACVAALEGYFAPLETFRLRFAALVEEVKRLGFQRMDVWQPAELNWTWAAPEHITAAREVLRQHAVRPTSLAGEFGETREQFLAACRVAGGIGAPLLSGTTALLALDRAFVMATLEQFDLRLAIENEVEQTPAEILAQIGDGAGGRIGAAVDTGWWASHGYDPAQAIRELRGHILHVHLKDVYPGEEHINCGYGRGCVPLRECVRALRAGGYGGPISVENHALDHDPRAELAQARQMLEDWLGPESG